MRDFKAGRDIKVGGDIHIKSESPQPKHLSMCTNEELIEELDHRRTLLSNERKRQWKSIAIMWLVCGVALSIVALWFYFKGDPNLSSMILGFGGLAVGFASIKVFEQPSVFEDRQLAALQEIKLILRERGIE